MVTSCGVHGDLPRVAVLAPCMQGIQIGPTRRSMIPNFPRAEPMTDDVPAALAVVPKVWIFGEVASRALVV
jgi:hypothetical protein